MGSNVGTQSGTEIHSLGSALIAHNREGEREEGG